MHMTLYTSLVYFAQKYHTEELDDFYTMKTKGND